MKADPEFDRRDHEEARENAVDAALPELLNRRQQFVDAAIAQHTADVAAYEFECCRHGDFLTVFTTRLDYNGKPSKFSTTLNLLLVTELRLVDGAEPAAETDVVWNFQHVCDGVTYSSRIMQPPGEGWVLRAWASIHPASQGRLAYREAPKSDEYHGMVHGVGDNGLRKGTMPAPARDDEIRFVGIGSALLVPFGLGQSVLDKILSEMASGQKRAPLDAEAGA